MTIHRREMHEITVDEIIDRARELIIERLEANLAQHVKMLVECGINDDEFDAEIERLKAEHAAQLEREVARLHACFWRAGNHLQ